jgi:putative membrane protein
MKKILKSKYKFENREKIILRDFLALERTRLANERTLFSYIRTSLYLLLGGIALFQLQGFERIKWLGYVSLALSVIFLFIGIIRFNHLKYKLKKYYFNLNNEQKQANKSESNT